MYCDQIQERLSTYMDGEIGQDVRAQIDEHLASCGSCREALARLRQVDAFLGSACAPCMSEGFAGRVMAQAREHATEWRRSPWESWSPFRWWVSSSRPMRVAAAAVMIVGLAVGVIMGRDTWQPPAALSAVSKPSAKVDVVGVYNLDYLTDAPRGSLAQVYVTLTSAQNGGRN